MITVKLPPVPQSTDVMSRVWQKWFTDLVKLIRDITEEFRQVNLSLASLGNDILFLTQRPQYRSKTGLPTLGEQQLGTYSVWRNNADGTFRIVINDGGAFLKAFELTPLVPI